MEGTLPKRRKHDSDGGVDETRETAPVTNTSAFDWPSSCSTSTEMSLPFEFFVLDQLSEAVCLLSETCVTYFWNNQFEEICNLGRRLSQKNDNSSDNREVSHRQEFIGKLFPFHLLFEEVIIVRYYCL